MTTKNAKPTAYGTREWAEKTINCCSGCSHDCLYCYAKYMAVRFKRMNPGDWSRELIREKDVYKHHTKYNGRVMFPSSHDITDGNWSACQIVLNNLLKSGNDILVVSKPHLCCIGATCFLFRGYRDKLIFRFSIGSCDDRVLSFWEPNAPSYDERKAALEHAYRKGFQTSISIEPMLDSANIDQLISDLLPYVTDSIWIGKMNHLGRIAKSLDEDQLPALRQIEVGQTDEIIRSIYSRHKDNPKIRWKDSIKKAVGLASNPEPGMDI
jgi:DNA repair photolyase